MIQSGCSREVSFTAGDRPVGGLSSESRLNPDQDVVRFGEVSGGGGDDGFAVDGDLFVGFNCPPHIGLTDEIDGMMVSGRYPMWRIKSFFFW